MRFVISHILNEEYLLQWWLPHHKDKFDLGLIIDYGSTDGSLDLIRKIVPHWQIVKTINANFRAHDIDAEVMQYERAVQQRYPFAWMITLNTTEFLIGNTNKLKQSYKVVKPCKMQKLIPCDVMTDRPEQEFTEPDTTIPLIKQRTFGMLMDYSPETIYNAHAGQRELLTDQKNIVYDTRFMRSLHNFPLNYFETSIWGAGRHYWGTPCEDFRILWYGYSPFNERLLKRKLAIQNQIPQEDKAAGNGKQHLLNKELAMERFYWHRQFSVELKNQIEELENRL